MAQQVLINAKLDPDKKKRWERAVEEESEYSSLSHLIRLSVSRELSGMYEQQSDVSTGEVDVDLGSVEEKLDEMQSKIDTIALKIDTIEAESLSSEDIIQLADDLYELIPKYEIQKHSGQQSIDTNEMYTDVMNRYDLDILNDDPDPEEVEYLLDTGILKVYQYYLEVSQYAIEHAAERLSNDYSRVRFEDVGGYYLIFEEEYE